MAVPTTIVSGNHYSPQLNARMGPWQIGGNIYAVIHDRTNGDIEMWKSTDNGVNFSEVDSANKPTDSTTTTGGTDAYSDGTSIWIAFVVAGGNSIKVRKFTSDAWVASESGMTTSPPTAVADVSGILCVYLTVRGDGNYVVLHGGTAEKVMGTNYRRVVYSRFQSSAWTTNTDVAGTGVEEHRDPRMSVLGSSSRSHFFYSKGNALEELYAKTLTSGNSLGSEESPTTDTISQPITWQYGGACAYIDGSDTKLVVPYIGSSDTRLGVMRGTSADSVTWTLTTIGTQDPESANSAPAAATANGTTIHIFATDDSTQDLYYTDDNGTNTWDSYTELRDAITVAGISVGYLSGRGAVGVIYYNGTNTVYDELIVSVASAAGLSRYYAEHIARIGVGG